MIGVGNIMIFEFISWVIDKLMDMWLKFVWWQKINSQFMMGAYYYKKYKTSRPFEC